MPGHGQVSHQTGLWPWLFVIWGPSSDSAKDLVTLAISHRMARGLTLLLVLLAPHWMTAYSLLTHEEIVDLAWADPIEPLLRQRFPAATADDLIEAHAYAYGGCVIQKPGAGARILAFLIKILPKFGPQKTVDITLPSSTTEDLYSIVILIPAGLRNAVNTNWPTRLMPSLSTSWWRVILI
jgi:hypothetical protein